MAYELSSSVKYVNPILGFYIEGPWTSVSDANTNIAPAIRVQGMACKIIIAGVAHIYWYRDGILDTDLVEFTSGVSTFSALTDSPYDNPLLADALNSKQDRLAGIVSGCEITVETFVGVGTNKRVRVTNGTWYITPSEYTKATDTVSAEITLCPTGGDFKYYDIVADDTNAITIHEGTPSTSPAHYVIDPLTQVLLGFITVGDAVIEEPAVVVTSLTKKLEYVGVVTGSFTLNCESKDFPSFIVRLNGTAATLNFSNYWNVVEGTIYLYVTSDTVLSLPTGSYAEGDEAVSKSFVEGYYRVTFGYLYGEYFFDFGVASGTSLTQATQAQVEASFDNTDQTTPVVLEQTSALTPFNAWWLGQKTKTWVSTTANQTDSANKRFVTDAEKVVIGNTSNTNSGNETASTIGALLTPDSTPLDTDLVVSWDGSLLMKTTWTNIKAFFKNYFDTFYALSSNKDATGGYVGLTLFKINFKNAANTFTSFLTNTNTAARTYLFQDKDYTVADNADVLLRAIDTLVVHLAGIETISALKTFSAGLKFSAGVGIYDANGNMIVDFSATTSAVNRVQFINSATGGVVTVTVSGSDTNIAVRFASKGAASVYLRTNSTDRVEVTSAGIVKFLAYTASQEKIATVLTDGSLSNTYNVVDDRLSIQNTALAAIVNSSENDIWGANINSLVLATTLVNVLGFSLKCFHKHTLVVGATPSTVVLKLKYNTTVIATITLDLALLGLSSSTVYIVEEVHLMTMATGASGLLDGCWDIKIINSTTNLVLFNYYINVSSTNNLTTDQTLKATITFASASVNSWTSTNGYIKLNS